MGRKHAHTQSSLRRIKSAANIVISGTDIALASNITTQTTPPIICGPVGKARVVMFTRIAHDEKISSTNPSNLALAKTWLYAAVGIGCRTENRLDIYFFIFLNLTYSLWTSSLPPCLWSQRIFSSLPGSRLTFFYRDASSALLQLVNRWLNFTYLRSHAFRYERKNTNPTLVRIELTTSVCRLAITRY